MTTCFFYLAQGERESCSKILEGGAGLLVAMVGGGDLARVAKGAGKVARAFLQVEGPVVARQALRLKEHGGGLAYSLKNVGSHCSAVATVFGCRELLLPTGIVSVWTCVKVPFGIQRFHLPPAALTRLIAPHTQSRKDANSSVYLSVLCIFNARKAHTPQH